LRWNQGTLLDVGSTCKGVLNMATPILQVRNLKKYFPIRAGLLRRVVAHVRAVDDVSFDVFDGATLGLVGESGSGKTTVGRTILRLIEPTAGEILFKGHNIAHLKPAEMLKFRRNMQMIFQDPYGSLNPRMTVGEIIAEPLVVHTKMTKSEIEKRVYELLEVVGLHPDYARRYPHEFSGGQRQRIGIARALALQPQFIVADEPVSALDVSIQAQVINLMIELQRKFGISFLFIAHDLAVVRHMSDFVAVMYLGKIMEYGSNYHIFEEPKHPYTQALLSAVPVPDPEYQRERIILQGEIPSPINPPKGCRFHTRCPYATEKCRAIEPPLRDMGESHFVACHYA